MEKYQRISKGEEFRTNLFKRLRELEHTERRPSDESESVPNAEETSDSLSIAKRLIAFLHWFTEDAFKDRVQQLPEALRKGHTEKELTDSLIPVLDDCVFDYSVKTRELKWMMNTGVRREVLNYFEKHPSELDQWLNILGTSDDPTESMLWSVLRGEKIKVATLKKDQLRTLLKVLSWCPGLVVDPPDTVAIERRIQKYEIMEPLRELTPDFRGRTKQLKDLRKYVDFLPSETAFESVSRGFGRFGYFLSLRDHLPLVVTGIGGVGKSTLIAEFIRSHVDGEEQGKNGGDGLIFVYIDFDHGHVSFKEPLGVLQEVVRQLGMIFLNHRIQWDRLLQDIKLRMRFGREDNLEYASNIPMAQTKQSFSSSGLSEQEEFIERFAMLVSECLVDKNSPILIVLDSFEEVQRLSDSVLEKFFDFFKKWIELVPVLRLVIAGRASIPETVQKTQEIKLEGFDKESAKAYLHRKGIKDEAIVKFIVDTFDLFPLTLSLVAEVWKKEKFDKQFIKDINSRSYFRNTVSKQRIQQELLQRNLDHIKDPRARKIAFPGMVVRYITPEIIREVLAIPCGLDNLGPNEAEEIMDALRQEKFLVEVSENRLQFRKDLRQAILPLVREESKNKSNAIHARAIIYFGSRTDPESKAEHIYHRLAMKEDPDNVKDLLEDGLDHFLSRSLDELPPNAHIMLANRYDIRVPEEIRDYADTESWEQSMIRQIQEAFEQDTSLSRLDSIRKQLEKRNERSNHSPLFIWEGWLYYRLGRMDDCIKAVRNAKLVAPFHDDTEMNKNILLLETRLYQHKGSYTEAFNAVYDYLSLVSENPEWSAEILSEMRRIVRLYDRLGTQDLDLASRTNQVLLDIASVHAGSILSNSEVNLLISQIIVPFIASARPYINATNTLKILEQNVIAKGLERMHNSEDPIDQEAHRRFIDELELLRTQLASDKKIFSNLYLNKKDFEDKLARLTKKVRNEQSLEEASYEILGVPLSRFVPSGAFEVRIFEFMLVVEYQDRMESLESYILKGPQAREKQDTFIRPEEISDIDDGVDVQEIIEKTGIDDTKTLSLLIKKLISQNKMDEAVKQFKDISVSSKNFENEGTLLNSRFNQLIKNYRTGVIQEGHYKTELNQITSSLLNYLDKM